MSDIDKEALILLAKKSEKELKKSSRRWKEVRMTKLVRFSNKSHRLIKKLSKERKMTMSKTLDFIIKKFMKHQRLYELD